MKSGMTLTALCFGILVMFLKVPANGKLPGKVTMMFPATRDLQNVSVFQIAKYKRYYEGAGLDVEFLEGRGGVYAAREVGAGRADFAEVFGDTEIVERSNGLPVKIVALMGGRGPTVLTARSDSGIATMQDLKGKKISILGYQDSTYYLLLAALASAHLRKEDVEIQAAGAPGVIQEFIDGKVDVCACIPEWIVTAENAGLKLRFLPVSDSVPILAHSIVSSDRMIAEHPEIVGRFVQATLRAYRDLRDGPLQAEVRLYEEAVPSQKGKDADLLRVYGYYARFAWKGQEHAGEVDRTRMEKLQDTYFNLKIISRRSPMEDLFTNQFVSP